MKKLKTIWTEQNRIAQERLEICRSCEFYDGRLGRCEKCGCFMDFKSLFSWASCPVDKWGPYDASELRNPEHSD